MSSKKPLIILAALLAVGGGLFAMRGKIAMAVMERVVDRSMAEDPLSSLPDGLRHGIIRLAAHAWHQRESDGPTPNPPAAVAALWRPWRQLRLT